MYNPEVKERFMNEISGNGRNERSCYAIFDTLGVFENSIGRDIAVMNEGELREALRHTNAGTYGSAFAIISLIRRYVKWCYDNRVFHTSEQDLSFLTVDVVDISEDLKVQLFRSEDDLIKALRSARPFDDGYFDVVVMLFFWLGISQKQMLNIKREDVDFFNKSVFVDGNAIPIPESFCEILSLYSKTKTGTRSSKNGPRTVYRDDSYDTFIRKFSSQNQLGKRITASQIEDAIYNLNKAYIELGNISRLTGGNVISSGALCRVFELEQSGVDIFSPKNKLLVVGAFRTKAKLHEILWLYRNYKRAFSL